jgi:hypothetical protein
MEWLAIAHATGIRDDARDFDQSIVVDADNEIHAFLIASYELGRRWDVHHLVALT